MINLKARAQEANNAGEEIYFGEQRKLNAS